MKSAAWLIYTVSVPVLLSSPARAGDKAYLDRMGCRLLLLICLLVVINCFVFVLSSGWL